MGVEAHLDLPGCHGTAKEQVGFVQTLDAYVGLKLPQRMRLIQVQAPRLVILKPPAGAWRIIYRDATGPIRARCEGEGSARRIPGGTGLGDADAIGLWRRVAGRVRI